MAENILRISLEVHIHSLFIFFTLSKQQKKSHYGAGAYNIKKKSNKHSSLKGRHSEK